MNDLRDRMMRGIIGDILEDGIDLGDIIGVLGSLSRDPLADMLSRKPGESRNSSEISFKALKDGKMVLKKPEDILAELDQIGKLANLENNLSLAHQALTLLLKDAARSENDFQARNDFLKERIREKDSELDDACQKNNELEEQLEESEKNISDLAGANEKIIGKNQELDDELTKAKDRISSLEDALLQASLDVDSLANNTDDPKLRVSLEEISEELMDATRDSGEEISDDGLEDAAAADNINRQDDFEIAEDSTATDELPIADAAEENVADQSDSTAVEETVAADANAPVAKEPNLMLDSNE
jgi:chromosome segregation ATPase